MFELMKELSHILRERRHRRGAIDFDFPEAKIILNESGEPVDIKAYDRNVATKIIEDFMLVANETVAEDYFWQEIPFLYRVHETPDDDKMKKLVTFCRISDIPCICREDRRSVQRKSRSFWIRSRGLRKKP